jgi:hypothetical protein
MDDTGVAGGYGYGDTDRSSDGIVVRLENGDGFAWGDTIQGTVTLEGSQQPTRVALLTVGIVEQDMTSYAEPIGYVPAVPGTMLAPNVDPTPPTALETRYEETVIARDITLPGPGESLSLPFSLTVPHGRSLTNGYFVVAHAAVASDGPDLTGSESFVLLPPRHAQAMIAALETFGPFEAIAFQTHPRESGDGDFYDLNFAAPESLRHALDGVRFRLEEDGPNIVGHIEVNPQEHTLREHLASLLRADRVRFPLSFPREALNAAARENRPPEAVVERLHEVLDPYLKRGSGAA